MIPARRQCPVGWTLEYEGYIASQTHNHNYQKSSYECLDGAPEVSTGARGRDRAVIYYVQTECGSLPCSQYVNGGALACVVCTK
jgi:hypothetical protein